MSLYCNDYNCKHLDPSLEEHKKLLKEGHELGFMCRKYLVSLNKSTLTERYLLICHSCEKEKELKETERTMNSQDGCGNTYMEYLLKKDE